MSPFGSLTLNFTRASADLLCLPFKPIQCPVVGSPSGAGGCLAYRHDYIINGYFCLRWRLWRWYGTLWHARATGRRVLYSSLYTPCDWPNRCSISIAFTPSNSRTLAQNNRSVSDSVQQLDQPLVGPVAPGNLLLSLVFKGVTYYWSHCVPCTQTFFSVDMTTDFTVRVNMFRIRPPIGTCPFKFPEKFPNA